MKRGLMKLTGILLMFNLMISGGSGQEFVGDYNIYYSDKLKTDMGFTWEIIKFDFILPPPPEGEIMPPSTTTITGSDGETTTVVVETTTAFDEIDIPDIKPGTLYTVKLLKDLGGLSQKMYWEDYNTNQDEYFQVSFSDPDIDTWSGNFGPEGFIEPNTIRFENGTELNFFEYRIDLIETLEGELPDDFEFGYKIENGVYFEKTNYSSYQDVVQMESQIDVDTGILLYLSLYQNITGFTSDVEMRLDHVVGIDINTFNGNGNPTLSVPLSPIFVYSIIILPIIIGRIRKQVN
ncbi:MAG: hypothetical protein GPJ54_21905 [Candidatus Heimdallarchaeota archaeon]|nr:hypothetical protein [Candidatus Heimdallarchaeota archaeon]